MMPSALVFAAPAIALEVALEVKSLRRNEMLGNDDWVVQLSLGCDGGYYTQSLESVEFEARCAW